MIAKHHKDAVTLSDGERDHRIKHDAFDWMKPHDEGGIHPGVTEEHHGHLHVEPGADLTGCPVQPVAVTVDDPMHPGERTTATMLPINAYLQAFYGPDKQIVTVPINGDAGAQRLHWIKRTPEERKEMKALLKWMNAWRLTEDGELPGPNDRVIPGTVDLAQPPLDPDKVGA